MRPVPAPARSVLAPGLDRLPGLMAGAPPARATVLGRAGPAPRGRRVLAGRRGGPGWLRRGAAPAAQQVTTWMATRGVARRIGNVEVDARTSTWPLARHDPPAAVREVCALLSNDAQTAIGNLPIPDDRS